MIDPSSRKQSERSPPPPPRGRSQPGKAERPAAVPGLLGVGSLFAARLSLALPSQVAAVPNGEEEVKALLPGPATAKRDRNRPARAPPVPP